MQQGMQVSWDCTGQLHLSECSVDIDEYMSCVLTCYLHIHPITNDRHMHDFTTPALSGSIGGCIAYSINENSMNRAIPLSSFTIWSLCKIAISVDSNWVTMSNGIEFQVIFLYKYLKVLHYWK